MKRPRSTTTSKRPKPIDDGGAASAMSLRDFLAAMVMVGDVANPDGGCLSLDATDDDLAVNVAQYYRRADSMLLARKAVTP
jgi:hypothetical protein